MARTLHKLSVSGSRSSQRGFTAIEVAMVATVIAILALIVLPLFRNRVDEAKIAAAKADLASLMKAEILAQADTGHYFRLEDLDNVATNTPATPPTLGITIETPPTYFNPPGQVTPQAALSPRGLTILEWRALGGPQTAPNFKGPYTAFSRNLSYNDLRNTPIGLYLLRSLTGSTSNYAAIRDLPQGGLPPGSDPQLFDSLSNRYPIDPWGNPYLFFPPTGETAYNYSSIFSLGPDGLPADEATRTALGVGTLNYQHFTREGVDRTNPNDDLLGKGDDLEVRF
jgi:prepilin-type N-terminal cleavage/methylation domain-containing protein